MEKLTKPKFKVIPEHEHFLKSLSDFLAKNNYSNLDKAGIRLTREKDGIKIELLHKKESDLVLGIFAYDDFEKWGYIISYLEDHAHADKWSLENFKEGDDLVKKTEELAFRIIKKLLDGKVALKYYYKGDELFKLDRLVEENGENHTELTDHLAYPDDKSVKTRTLKRKIDFR